MQIGTWIMLFVSIAWLALFVVFTVKDLREEGKKSAILDSGQPLDPFKFSGEKARVEAKVLYAKDPVARHYMDENGITPFLDAPAGKA